ncbi:MAG: dihydropteroate synthase, partial [Pseudohongiellaceae bacterium]
METLKAGKHLLDLKVPLCMGVINVTPDSFSDGGGFSKNTTNLFEVDISKVLHRVESYVEDGVSIIDIGGVSTRPGAASVELDIELHRTIPVIEAVKKNLDIPLSIDT